MTRNNPILTLGLLHGAACEQAPAEAAQRLVRLAARYARQAAVDLWNRDELRAMARRCRLWARDTWRSAIITGPACTTDRSNVA